MTTLIPRPQYTERIAPFIGKNIIKVLPGSVVSARALSCVR